MGFLTCGMRTVIMGRTKWKPLELPLPTKIVNKEQYHIPGEFAKITVTIKDLKDSGLEIPTIQLAYLAYAETAGSWTMTVDY